MWIEKKSHYNSRVSLHEAPTKNENFQQSHSAKKPERKNPLGFFNIRSVAKYQNKLKGGPFEDIKKFSKKSLTKPKKREESHSAESENLLLRNTCKKISTYSRVGTRTLRVEKQASYH